VVASDPNDDWQWETELRGDYPWRDQLIAEVDRLPIGFLQIIDPAEEVSRYWGDVPANLRAIDIWIGEAAFLGRGYGTRMMRWAIDFCFADRGVEAILVDPLSGNTRAIRFYQRLGFKPVGERRFGDDLCLVHRLDRADWQGV
jgi:aminoglycoside 6'-N-acetyltransferase